MFEMKSVIYRNILNIDYLSIRAGKATCITGASGSGKTTLLRMLNKMISPDSGDIYYRGINLRDTDSVSHRREVLMLPQSPVVYDGSIRDNLLIGLRFAQKPLPDEQTLVDILARIRLEKSLDESAGELSGGERQRLCLARIVLMDGEVYLLDEPSSSLDSDTEDLILGVMADFTESGSKTLIMVTHSRNAAENYSDEIIELFSGSVRTEGRKAL